jgi:hypothetical protein
LSGHDGNSILAALVMIKFRNAVFIFLLVSHLSSGNIQTNKWDGLVKEAVNIGKTEWRDMLEYVARLHENSTHPPVWPFENPWEEIGTGYIYGPAFGHWDIIHQVFDVLPSYPEHALLQLKNNILNQESWGLLPGSFWMPGSVLSKNDTATWSSHSQGHPPFWPVAVDEYVAVTGDTSVIKFFYTVLIRQIAWFENMRKAERQGFYYIDILTKNWESGVDEGIRFDGVGFGKWACIDATSHVWLLYKTAVEWQKYLGLYDPVAKRRKSELESFIQNDLYDNEKGLFFDAWSINDKDKQTLAFETFFPLITGVATVNQAMRLIDEYLLNTSMFLLHHPVPTVGHMDPKFELRMWRGPAWNSMTWWIARGCINYNRPDAALVILERALDNSAYWYDKTGTIWEFYDPLGGDPRLVKRKKGKHDQPCPDYLGHNPLIDMARMYHGLVKHRLSP